MPEIALVMNGVQGGHAQIEDEHGHGEGEDAVAESGQPLDALSGDAVVAGLHERARYEFVRDDFLCDSVYITSVRFRRKAGTSRSSA